MVGSKSNQQGKISTADDGTLLEATLDFFREATKQLIRELVTIGSKILNFFMLSITACILAPPRFWRRGQRMSNANGADRLAGSSPTQSLTAAPSKRLLGLPNYTLASSGPAPRLPVAPTEIPALVRGVGLSTLHGRSAAGKGLLDELQMSLLDAVDQGADAAYELAVFLLDHMCCGLCCVPSKRRRYRGATRRRRSRHRARSRSASKSRQLRMETENKRSRTDGPSGWLARGAGCLVRVPGVLCGLGLWVCAKGCGACSRCVGLRSAAWVWEKLAEGLAASEGSAAQAVRRAARECDERDRAATRGANSSTTTTGSARAGGVNTEAKGELGAAAPLPGGILPPPPSLSQAASSSSNAASSALDLDPGHLKIRASEGWDVGLSAAAPAWEQRGRQERSVGGELPAAPQDLLGEPPEQLRLLEHGCADPVGSTGHEAMAGLGLLSTPKVLQPDPVGSSRYESRRNGKRGKQMRASGSKASLWGQGTSDTEGTQGSAAETDPVAVRLLKNVMGIPVLTYVCESADGYRLRLIRMPRRGSSRVAYFQHGLLDSSSAWVSGGRVFGMGVRAWREGYDVYLGNLRGTDDTLGYGALVSNHQDAAGSKNNNSSSTSSSSASGAASASSASSIEGTSTARRRQQRRRRPSSSATSAGGTDTDRRRGPPVPPGSMLRLKAHRSLAPSDAEFWRFTVEDHTLDVMALVDRIVDIKRAEGAQREAWQRKKKRKKGAAGSASRRRDQDQDAHSRLPGGSKLRPDRGASATSGGAKSPVGRPGKDAACDPGRSQSAAPDKEDFYEAEDVRITGVGHSMGGCLLLLHILQCRALGRPHHISRSILLSPAGMHKSVNGFAYFAIHAAYPVVHLLPHGPFMRAPRALQRVVARLTKDFVGQQATADALAAVSSSMFGGLATRFAFRDVVDVTEYNVGGTSVGVMRHGCQGLIARDINAFDHGAARNRVRYGQDSPPCLRADFGLIDVPVHFVAGGLDVLIPPENIELMATQLQAIRPGIATYHCFPELGHLDFTLSRDDGLVQHVLQRLREPDPEVSATQWLAHRRWQGRHPTVACPTTGDTRLATVSDAPARLARYPLATVAEARARAASSPKRLHLLDPDLGKVTRESVTSAQKYGESADGPYQRAAGMARSFPFLGTYMKLREAWEGVDARAAWEKRRTAALALARGRESGLPGAAVDTERERVVSASGQELRAAEERKPGQPPRLQLPGSRSPAGSDAASKMDDDGSGYESMRELEVHRGPQASQMKSRSGSTGDSSSGSESEGERRRVGGGDLPLSPSMSRRSSAASSLTMLQMPVPAGGSEGAGSKGGAGATSGGAGMERSASGGFGGALEGQRGITGLGHDARDLLGHADRARAGRAGAGAVSPLDGLPAHVARRAEAKRKELQRQQL